MTSLPLHLTCTGVTLYLMFFPPPLLYIPYLVVLHTLFPSTSCLLGGGRLTYGSQAAEPERALRHCASLTLVGPWNPRTLASQPRSLEVEFGFRV